MTRYLLYISYFGTQFRAVQKQIVNAEPSRLDYESVQGILEIISKRFHPVEEPHVYVSSRTDQGVHALRSAAHVDLVWKDGPKHASHLFNYYNKYLGERKLDLRVQCVKQVPDTFHARFSAKSRTYLYRLAVRKPDAPPYGESLDGDIPYAEWNKCHFIQKAKVFDISLLKSAACLFPGTRDFQTFMGSASKLPDGYTTVREMYKLDVVPGRPFLDAEYCPSSMYYNYWNIICHSKSFLFRQIRRIVGALIAVAQRDISIREIRYMLECPSKDSWNSKIKVVPAYGLYLVDVEYDPLDMVISKETDYVPSNISSQESDTTVTEQTKVQIS